MASRLQSLMEQRQAADSHAATDLLGPMFAGAGTDLDLLSSLISWSDQALSHAQHLTPVIQRGLAEAARTRAETVQGLETTTARMLTALVELAKVDAGLLTGGTSHHETADRLLQAGNDPEGLYYCASSSVLADPLDQAGFRSLREHLAAHSGTLDDLAGACEALILRQLAKSVYEHHGPQLGTFVGSHLDSQRRLVASLDRELIALGRKDLRARVKDAARPPRGNGTGKKSTFTEMALIDNEISKSKRYAPVRDLTQRAGRALQELKPCWMMSPLAVAQYVPRNTIKFDLCIIDEASQMPPESALGALMRASQTVVVGDTNQLPPSNFFRTVVDDEDDDEDETVLNESILEMANATFRPPRRLRWHYRSRHSALIAFSNRLVYDDDLVVFPSADEGSKRMGVELREVPGLYKSGTNPLEAQALVDAAMAFMRSDPDRSLGIVTLNQKQRELVREEFEARSASDTQVQDYLERWREQNDGLEEFFIKNLENVQGDERDVIFIGTVYGRETEGTRVMQRFGPINGLAGRRRLNVLFTRAKEKVVTFSSMTSADIVADENGNAGAYMLKRWLEYARTGVLEAGKTTKREPDSEFEVYVINQIKAMGCEPVPQVGVAGYFIDIGIRHPQWPHGYLLGVECDGANYHSAKSARDRDRLRQEVLEGLGWRLHRIWSTDWFNNPHREAERLRQAIAQRLEQLKAKEQDYVRPDPAPNIAAAATPISALSARASERLSRSDEGPGRETTQVRGHRQPASDTRTSRDQPLTVAAARDMGVSIGDTVRVTYLAGGKQVSVRVTRDKSDASNGIIHCETPLAKALLGAEEGEEISVLIRNQVQRARVEEIIRPSLGR